ncbi:MAG TPA: nuclear transport factor 2 family protein [Gemmatimonadales bacterium]|nr:nuclear transport factor 2 family protein [Gemmatimonadales bacterium]
MADRYCCADSWVSRRGRALRLGGLFALSLLSGSGLSAQMTPADSVELHRLARQFSAAFVRGDAAAMADLYTPDGVIFPERSEWISGRDAIRRYFTPAPGRRVTHHLLTPSRIVVDGRHAYDYGTYEIAGERDGTAWGPIRGKYVVVWRRQGDSWRMQLDIWNSLAEPES